MHARPLVTLLGSLLVAAATAATAFAQAPPLVTLEGRAVLPAATFAPGPTSGTLLGSAPINGISVPFTDRQPVQGFSAVLDNGDGTFDAMSDNGFGSIENSADYNLRVYRIRPDFETAFGGQGTIDVEGFVELRDPDRRIPFAITNHFSSQRVLTGADFDIESMQRTSDGTLWFGDEFGPFLLHTDATGRVLEAPIGLPDFDNPGRELRSPQNPFNEEGSAVRIMNAVRAHAQANGNRRAPVISPWHVMLDDGNPATFVDNRQAPPPGSGLTPASSEIFNVASLKAAGYPVVPYTINDLPRMLELMRLGVDGIISDRPDLLLQAVRQFDANRDGIAGDFLTADGLIDGSRFDAQGHRGGRDLRPENTLPAAEVALDNLMTTIEGDVGVTSDGVGVLSHDPYVESAKCRRADGAPYGQAEEVLIKNLTRGEIQSRFICDRLFRGPTQTNDLALSPVTVAFGAARAGLANPYAMPTVQQLFQFVDFYAGYYRSGAGASHPGAALRALNAERVRFNLETKLNPRTDTDDHGNVFASRTLPPAAFMDALARPIWSNRLSARADIQSFDFRTLLLTQELYPSIRTVYLFGDFPKFADPTIAGSDDGTNLQPQGGSNTPWLAGPAWPYRVTALTQPFRVGRSLGFEGMALTSDGTRLLPLLEGALVGGDPKTLLIHEFALATRRYTGTRYRYVLEPRGTNIGDFIMTSATRGLVIEREGSQGDLNGFKAIYEITLPAASGGAVSKRLVVDLLNISDPFRISEPGLPGDVGLGSRFAFPFTTIEDVVLLGPDRIGVLNDNNFPFSVGRHVGTRQPDDNEFIVLRLGG